ncbi:competence protein TfoX [Phyllobacterium phragmitis]|uniref:Competence protein TfoX n=1 Tax=Phyllobacterium phragmitis TaxID=2670329 RepID=A0A2S9INE7_9HYPH|nr:TfoX/Sxy family protein [Phyllobacterium phragmitis]PRD42056.1 competence protein TfoX [Phyllobacterium phragmitis]
MDDDDIRDLFSSLGPIVIKRLFGGKGIYHDGLIIAIEYRDEILLKADEISAPFFEEAGCVQWTYAGKNRSKPVAMPYWSIPGDALDDPDIMAEWARRAYEAAMRSRK